MDWQAIGTIIALLAVVVSFWMTRKGQQQERRIAENSASRSEAAAALTEDYTRRVVDALEAIAVGGLGVSTPPAKVVWSLVHDAGDTFRLTNVGEAEASGVRVTAHESMGGLIDPQGGPDLGHGEAITFMAAPSMATTDSTITVEWTQPDGTSGRWRYPLPASQ